MNLIKSLIVLMLSAFGIASLGSEAGGDMGGNGGGGIVRNGRYLTFGSARVRVHQKSAVRDIPGMALIDRLLLQVQIDNSIKGALINALYPSASRTYYDISEQDLSMRQKEELIAIYRQELNLPNEEIALFAITNIQLGETYLLPDFYKLEKVEEWAAILFHEAAWMINPKLAYKNIVDLEIVFQDFLESKAGRPFGYEPNFYQVLAQLFQNHRIPIVAAIREDYRRGRFDSYKLKRDGERRKGLDPLRGDVGAFRVNEIPLEVLFGQAAMASLYNGLNTIDLARSYFAEMAEKHPEMQSFSALLFNLRQLTLSSPYSGAPKCQLGYERYGDLVEGQTFDPRKIDASLAEWKVGGYSCVLAVSIN